MADETTDETTDTDVADTEDTSVPESAALPQNKGTYAAPTPLPMMPMPSGPSPSDTTFFPGNQSGFGGFLLRFLDNMATDKAGRAGQISAEQSKQKLLDYHNALQYNTQIQMHNAMQQEAYQNTMAQLDAKKKARMDQADIIQSYADKLDDGDQKQLFQNIATGLRADLDPSVMGKLFKQTQPKTPPKLNPEEQAIAEYQKNNPKASYQQAKNYVEQQKSDVTAAGTYTGKTQAAMNDPDIKDMVDAAAKNGDIDADSLRGFGAAERNAFVKLMARDHPEVDQAKLKSNIGFITNQKANQQVQYINGVIPRLQSILTKLSQTHPTPFPSLNAAKLWLQKEGGDADVVDYLTNTNSTIMESVRALTGSVQGSELRTKLELSNLNKNYNNPQMVRAVGNQLAALNSMKDARNLLPFPDWNKRGKDKPLDQETMQNILKTDANNNPQTAREVAKKRGYTHYPNGQRIP